MRKHNSTPNHNCKAGSVVALQRKGNELKAVYEYLQTNIATATMTATALNIYRPSLCRCKRTLEKAGLLVEVKPGRCKITRCTAAYLTTNPAWFPIHSQLKLF